MFGHVNGVGRGIEQRLLRVQNFVYMTILGDERVGWRKSGLKRVQRIGASSGGVKQVATIY